MPLIVDAHQDLAWNILTFGRDYTRPAAETRRREAGGLAPEVNGDTLLGHPEYQRGRVAVIFSTLFAAPQRYKEGAWDTQVYGSDKTARRLYSAQLDVYHRLVNDHPALFRLVLTQGDLQAVLAQWEQTNGDLEEGSGAAAEPGEPEAAERAAARGNGNGRGRAPDPEAEAEHRPAPRQVGLVVSMEGAEAVQAPAELEEWWERGVRWIGPAWAGTRFCGGTREPGGLTQEGFTLLEAMAAIGFGLDITHMDEAAARQAIDSYPGTIIASHSNALALLKGVDTNRHLSDRIIHGLIERDGVIGVVPANKFLRARMKRTDRRELANLQLAVAQIDYICQMAGDAQHVGLGSDYDGGFGLQQVPPEIDTIADLQKLGPLLAERGYEPGDIAAILGGNWLARLRRVLPHGA